MSLKVLQNQDEVARSRATLNERSLGGLPSAVRKRLATIAQRFRIKALLVGDALKSWDLLLTVEFLERHVDRGSPILDIGAYASEVLVSLHKDGFTDLTGVDLNPRLHRMPYRDAVKYVISDFMSTPFKDGSFSAITSVSVIEHGYNPERLLAEVSRLLRPNGYFIASTDYWRDKIDTGDRRIFDMSWRIFSEAELKQMVDIAERHGLRPAGDWHPETGDRVVKHAGFQYTFAWLAFQKRV